MILKFGIEHWDAWAPGLREKSDWQTFLTSDESRLPEGSAISYLYLTPRQRRRLSDISKITLDVAVGAVGKYQQVPTVFASRRGEVSRMAELLQDICSSGEASPTAFSLSVHNTASGLFSIQTGNTAPSTAIAAGHDTVLSALVEACAQIACGHDKVLLVISEDVMPEVYAPFQQEGEHSIAAAFLLTNTDDYQLEVTPSLVEQAAQSTSEQLVQLLKIVCCKQSESIHGERTQCKTLSC